MINAEQFFILITHISQRVDLALRVHGEEALWLVGNIGDRDTALWPPLSGGNQAADFRIRGGLRLMQDTVNQMSRQDDSFHGLTITSFGSQVYPASDREERYNVGIAGNLV
jgi:hypothetical protein